MEDFPISIETYAEEAYMHHDSVNIRTENVQKSIQLLLDNNIPLSRIEIRARTLDDLFIELTGNDLKS